MELKQMREKETVQSRGLNQALEKPVREELGLNHTLSLFLPHHR